MRSHPPGTAKGLPAHGKSEGEPTTGRGPAAMEPGALTPSGVAHANAAGAVALACAQIIHLGALEAPGARRATIPVYWVRTSDEPFDASDRTGYLKNEFRRVWDPPARSLYYTLPLVRKYR